MELKLNGHKIPTPRENIKIDYLEISKSERAITGRLRKEIVAIKHIFTLTYQGLSAADADIFITAYEAGAPVVFEYEERGRPKAKMVFITSLPREIYSPKPDLTQNITVGLEEA